MASDLFRFLKEMNQGNFRYVDGMSEKETKAISPFVLLMWCSGAEQEAPVHSVLTDTYVNDYVFTLSKHPKLLHKLFFAANGGVSNTKYAFRKSVTNEETKVIDAICFHYNCTPREAKDYKRILDKDSLDTIKQIYEDRS